jgi:hypothetical protein
MVDSFDVHLSVQQHARQPPVLMLLLHVIHFGSALGWKVACQLLLLLLPSHAHTLKLQGAFG